jgi:hypothetical protein
MKNLITNTIKLSKMETFKFKVEKGTSKGSISVDELNYNLALKEANRRAKMLGFTLVLSVACPVMTTDLKGSLINEIIVKSETNEPLRLRSQLETLQPHSLSVILDNVEKYVFA